MQEPWTPTEKLPLTDVVQREWTAEDDECEFILKPYIPGQLPPGTPCRSVFDADLDEVLDPHLLSALCSADSRIDYNRQIGILVGEENMRFQASEAMQGIQQLSIVH